MADDCHDSPVEITFSGGLLLVWGEEQAAHVLSRCRIVGSHTGLAAHTRGQPVDPRHKSRLIERLPLVLMHEEAALMVDRGMGTVIDDDGALDGAAVKTSARAPHALTPSAWRRTDEAQRRRDRLFAWLWSQSDSTYITGASKFGGDFLVYRGGPPGAVHSEAVVRLLPTGQTSVPVLDMLAFVRLAQAVRKKVFLATVSADGSVACVAFAGGPRGWNKRLVDGAAP